MTTNNDFNECLQIWEQFELFVVKMMKEKYNFDYVKNPNKVWIDLLWWFWNIEVKHDKKSDHTWNYFIETMYNNKFSWIFKYKNMKYYCIWHFDEAYILEKNKLISIILLYWKKVIWWDWNKSIWYIIEKKYIKKFNDYNF